MKKKKPLFILVITIVFAVIFIIQNKLPDFLNIANKPANFEENLNLENCEEEVIKNLKSNEYLMAEQLSVLFYSKPSEDLIDKIAEKYGLDIVQVYNDPNVVYKVKEESAPIIKCQLENEPEVKKVVFIESRPLPL